MPAKAARGYARQLRRPPGEAARAYLDRRGLGVEDRDRFGLGYAPAGRTALKDHLVARGARPGDLVEAGLLIAPEDGSAPYERFRDRGMFPITDGRGRGVRFGGRALDPNARAKYLNGPETALFHKGRTLYGVPEARRLLQQAEVEKRAAPLVVVEGYMDAIACARAGVAAVAGQGTALTEEQMEALWRLHSEPTLCFDGDAAGRRAADRAIDRALPLLKPGRSFRFAAVEGGKDPDEVLREQGAEALRTQLDRTEPFVARLFARERDAEPLGTPESHAGLKVRLRKRVRAIQDGDVAQAYGVAIGQALVDLRSATRSAQRREFAAPRISPPRPETLAAARRLRGMVRTRSPDMIRVEAEVEQAKAVGDFARLMQLKRDREALRRAATADG